MPSLTDDGVIREGVAEEVDVSAGDLTGENVTMFLLSAAEEFQRIGAKLKRATHVRDPAVFYRRFSRLPETHTLE